MASLHISELLDLETNKAVESFENLQSSVNAAYIEARATTITFFEENIDLLDRKAIYDVENILKECMYKLEKLKEKKK